jgi:uncharacterized protein GlcG (DUF336 family)
VELAISKPVTARMFDKPTSLLAELAQPGAALYGIQQAHSDRVVVFGGGVPVTLDNMIDGAVGASAGTVEQDIIVASAAAAVFGKITRRLAESA